MAAKGRGGRMPSSAYGKAVQAKGEGKNAKRHDLERPKTPGLHGSDLQQGDVQAMEQGQRMAPAQTQQQGQPQIATQQQVRHPDGTETSSMQIPDAIDFLGERNGEDFNLPQEHRALDNTAALTWLPILRMLAGGPGASGALVNALINQARTLSQQGSQPATWIDFDATDAGIEAMLDESEFEVDDEDERPLQPPQSSTSQPTPQMGIDFQNPGGE